MSFIQRIDFWMPLIRQSIGDATLDDSLPWDYEKAKAAAAEVVLPNLEEMPYDKAIVIFGELLGGLMKASGVEAVPEGEAKPVPISGAESTAS